MKMDVFWSLLQPKRKKDAATMVCTNMILIGTLKDNMNFDVLTRSCFQFTYFLLFLLDEAPERKKSLDFDDGCRNRYGRRTPQPWHI